MAAATWKRFRAWTVGAGTTCRMRSSVCSSHTRATVRPWRSSRVQSLATYGRFAWHAGSDIAATASATIANSMWRRLPTRLDRALMMAPPWAPVAPRPRPTRREDATRRREPSRPRRAGLPVRMCFNAGRAARHPRRRCPTRRDEAERRNLMRGPAGRLALVVVALLVVVAALAAVALGRLPGPGDAPAGSGPVPAAVLPRFVEETATAGVEHSYDGEFEFFVGGGVAVFDCDDDGRPELY